MANERLSADEIDELFSVIFQLLKEGYRPEEIIRLFEDLGVIRREKKD